MRHWKSYVPGTCGAGAVQRNVARSPGSTTRGAPLAGSRGSLQSTRVGPQTGASAARRWTPGRHVVTPLFVIVTDAAAGASVTVPAGGGVAGGVKVASSNVTTRSTSRSP